MLGGATLLDGLGVICRSPEEMGKLPQASAPPRALPPLRESAAADQSAVPTLQTYLVQAVGLPGSEKGDKGSEIYVPFICPLLGFVN